MTQYNSSQYNTRRYNAQFEVWKVAFTSDIPLSRFSGYNKNKYNTTPYNAGFTSDVLSKSLGITISNSQFLQDNEVKKQIAKGLSEETRIAVWLSVKQKNPAQWSDE